MPRKLSSGKNRRKQSRTTRTTRRIRTAVEPRPKQDQPTEQEKFNMEDPELVDAVAQDELNMEDEAE
jgi:hypothetical protein